MSWTLNEIKSSLKSQIQDVITTAIDEKVLPSIQNTLDTQARSNFTMADRSSSGLQRNLSKLKVAPKRVLRRKSVDKCLKKNQ